MSGVVSSTTVQNSEAGVTITISASVTIADPAPDRARLADAVNDLTDALRRQVKSTRRDHDPSHEERSA